jgi:hypothetical protein
LRSFDVQPALSRASAIHAFAQQGLHAAITVEGGACAYMPNCFDPNETVGMLV